MKILFFYFILFTVLLEYGKVLSQVNLEGIVVDEDLKPLKDVHVSINNLKLITITDESGRFKFNNLSKGKIIIKTSYVGYSTQFQVLDLKKDTFIEFRLKKSTIFFDEIVVSAAHETSILTSPIKVNILKNENNFSGEVSLIEALKDIPGVNLITQGGGRAKPSIRGLSCDNIIVLKNGAKIDNYQYSLHHPISIEEASVEQVEVIKGPVAFIYGSDAVGGIINYITKKPISINSIQSNLKYNFFSNTLGHNIGIDFMHNHKKLFYGINGSFKSHLDYLQGGGNIAFNTRFNEKSLASFTSLSHKIGLSEANFSYLNQKFGIPIGDLNENKNKRNRKIILPNFQYDTYFGQFLNKIFIKDIKIEVQNTLQDVVLTEYGECSHYNHLHIDEDNLENHKNEHLDISMRLFTIQNNIKTFVPIMENSELIFGIDYSFQNNRNLDNPKYFLLPNAIVNNFALFTVITYKEKNIITPQFGLRYDFRKIKSEEVLIDNFKRPSLDKKFNNLNGSLALLVKLNELRMRSIVSSGYRIPNLAELTTYGLHDFKFEIGNINLKPQKSINFEINVEMDKKQTSFDFNFYYNNLYNYIYIAPTGLKTDENYPIYKYTQSNAVVYGSEISVYICPKNFEWFNYKISYTYTLGKQRSGEYLPLIPASGFVNEINLLRNNFKNLKNIKFGIKTINKFKQSKISPEETPTPAYFVVDLFSSIDLPLKKHTVNLAFGIKNLLDTKYVDHLSLLKDIGFYEPKRNFFVSIKYNFETFY